jgi:hypothetical protein
MGTHARPARSGVMAPLRHRDFRLLITRSRSARPARGPTTWPWPSSSSSRPTRRPGWGRDRRAVRPGSLLGAYGGVLAERFERVRLMVGLDWVCAALMCALTVVAALEGPPALAIGLAGLTSLCGIAYEPAVAAITPETVPETDLAAANTLRNTVDNVAIVAGPAIGAALLFAGPPSVAFAVNALSFVWSALVVSPDVGPQPSGGRDGGRAGRPTATDGGGLPRHRGVGDRHHAGRLQRHRQLRLRRRHRAVRGPVRGAARHRRQRLRLPARRPRGRRGRRCRPGQPAGRPAAARDRDPCRDGGLLPCRRCCSSS